MKKINYFLKKIEKFVNNNEKPLVSIDIGSTKICCIIAEKDKKTNYFNILSNETVPVKSFNNKSGLIGDMSSVQQKIQECIDSAISNLSINKNMYHFLENSKIHIGVAHRSIRCIKIKKSIQLVDNDFDQRPKNVTQAHINQLREIVKQEARCIKHSDYISGSYVLDIYEREFTIDGREVSNPLNQKAIQLGGVFQVVIIPSDIVKSFANTIYDAFDESNLDISFYSQGYASSLACVDSKSIGESAIILDIGGYYSNIAFFYDNCLIDTVDIPIGSILIDEAIKKYHPTLTLTEASEFKKKGTILEENADIDKQIEISSCNIRVGESRLASIINWEISKVAEKVKQEIKKLKNTDPEVSFGNLYITGGGALIRDIDKFFEFKLCIKTQCRLPFQYLHEAKQNLEYCEATAWGLILAGNQKNKITQYH